MRTVITTALAAVLVIVTFPAFASTAHYVTKAQDIDVAADRISVTQSGNIVIAGNVSIKSVDKATKAVMDATGSKVILKFAQAKSRTANAQFDSLTSADITGPTTMVYTITKPTGVSKTTATAKNATYSDSDKLAHLMGGVKVVQEDPAFTGPAVITGETAVVNLNPTPGPDDIAVKVETPGGVSRIEGTPTATDSVFISAATILTKRDGSVTLQDNAYIKRVDNTTQTVMEAKGSKAVMKFEPVGTGASNIQFSSLQNAEIIGPVTIIDTVTKPTGAVKTTATANNATYSGTDQIAHLNGGVKVVQEDPTYAAPSVMTGETAMVNLNPNPGPDDITVQVDTPGGVSRIEVTPKPKEAK